LDCVNPLLITTKY
jgi:predicted ATPase